MIVYFITSQYYNHNKDLKVTHIIYIPYRSIGFYLDKIDQSTVADIFNDLMQKRRNILNNLYDSE